jgi:hypothetical protein
VEEIGGYSELEGRLILIVLLQQPAVEPFCVSVRGAGWRSINLIIVVSTHMG